MIELVGGSHEEITNSVTSWAAYREDEMVTLVGVFGVRSDPSILRTQSNASLQFRMTNDVARKLLRQLAALLPAAPYPGD